MNPIFAAALEVQAFCRERGWRFCFIGGLAALGRASPHPGRQHDPAHGLRNGSAVRGCLALFEERAVARASEFVIQPGVALVTCSAEDLIVFKAFAGRERDWLDIEGIALRQRGRLDESLIWAELGPLLTLKEEPETPERLRAVLDRARR